MVRRGLRCWRVAVLTMLRGHSTQDLFLTKPLREEDVAVVRAHAAAYTEARRLEADHVARVKAEAAAAAARAAMANEVLGLPLVAAAQSRGGGASKSLPYEPGSRGGFVKEDE
jgi:hypothetical protein